MIAPLNRGTGPLAAGSEPPRVTMTPTKLPTGTVSFLFTDIEGSTRLWESDPTAMREALARHDQIVRSAIEGQGGIVFKTVGDAFCAAFERADNAATAAIEAQRRLAEEQWPGSIDRLRVRAGIHTGTVSETEGDYFGPTVNRVARLMSVGYGEQILVSGATAALLRDTLPAGTTLRDLGTHRLKDLSEPEQAHQVVAPGLRSEFPALRTIDSRPNNLPFQISTFIGRERELDELRDALAERRLVTVVGPGGIGKTRLALQAAADVIDRFADGAWVVELAHLRNGELIPQAVAEVLRVRENPQEQIEQTIARELAERELLLVLDSAEHLLAPLAVFVKAILSRSAAVKVMVTSREPLHLTGEFVLRVGALQNAAELLLDRAREVVAGFVADRVALEAVEQICGRLECIPLAIELAAARAATMTLPELNARLARSLGMLVSRDPTKEERHRTLRATIAWSYGLLNDAEVRVLRALGAFAGSFDVAAVAAVADGAEDEMRDIVEALVDKSLVGIGAGDGGRFIVSDAVRDYLVDQLHAGGALNALAERHFAHYARLVADGPARFGGVDAPARLDELAAEMNNLRAALDWAIDHRAESAAQLAMGLTPYWHIRGYFSEGRRWMQQLLEHPEVRGAARGGLLRRNAMFAIDQDAYDEAHALSIEARELFEAAGDRRGIGEAVHNLAVIAQRRGRLEEAEACYRRAVDEFRAAEYHVGEFFALFNLTLLAFDRDELDPAAGLIEEAATAAARQGGENLRGSIEGLRGDLDRRRGDYPQAVLHYQRAIALKRAVGHRYDVGDIHDAMAIAYLRLNEVGAAQEAARETLRAALETEATSLAIMGFETFAEIAVHQQRFEQAARYLCLSRVLRRTSSYEPSARSVEQIRRTVEAELGARLDDVESECAAGEWRTVASALIERD